MHRTQVLQQIQGYVCMSTKDQRKNGDIKKQEWVLMGKLKIQLVVVTP